MVYGIGFLVSYLLGSIPFGFLVARAKGVDIRTVGSGNIGATNVFRTLGKGPGILTFLLDSLKGLVSVIGVSVLVNRLAGPVAAENLPILKLVCGIGAMVGHTFPLFLGFHGGKGVATGVGLVAGLAPAVAGIGLAVWLVVFLIGRYVSLASIIAAIAVVALSWTPLLGDDSRHVVPIILSVLGVLVVLRHHANIGRLLKGTENRFSFGRKAK